MKLNSAVACIVKNERPYIVEWVAYHKLKGFEGIIIADNGGADDTSGLLIALDKLGLIHRIDFPTQNNQPPQLAAYKRIFSEFESKYQWLAFLDADEFLSFSKKTDDVQSFLSRFDKDKVGAVVVNWAVYGSSSRLTAGDGLVTDRFTRRAAQSFGVNRHYKTIANTDGCVGPGTNPHFFEVKPEFAMVKADGSPAQDNEKQGLSATPDWNGARINHYVVKSKEEFFLKKQARGRATTQKATHQRTIDFFYGHDKNDEVEVFPKTHQKRLKAEVDRIIQALNDAGYEYHPDANRELFVAPDSLVSGVVDKVTRENDTLRIIGWIANEPKGSTIKILLNHSTVLDCDIVARLPRQDVAQAGVSGSGDDFGFEARLDISALKDAVDSPLTSLEVYGGCVGDTVGKPLGLSEETFMEFSRLCNLDASGGDAQTPATFKYHLDNPRKEPGGSLRAQGMTRISGWVLSSRPATRTHLAVMKDQEGVRLYKLNKERSDVISRVLNAEPAGHPELLCGFDVNLFIEPNTRVGFEHGGQFKWLWKF